MLLWFVGTSVLAVWYVFRDTRFDYRWLVLGVLLPDPIDALTGGAGVLHSVAGAVAVLTLVMLLTIGRRALRKRLLGVPIGLFLHLVFDGAFASTKVFWWPFSGGSFEEDGQRVRLPLVDRGAWNVLLELAGLVLVAWIWRRFDLGDRARRRRAVQTGQLLVSDQTPARQ